MHEDDDILVEKINGMWSVANNVSGPDALVRIIIGKDDAGVNKMTNVSLRQTNNETTIYIEAFFVCINCGIKILKRVTSKKKYKRYPKTWRLKYKDKTSHIFHSHGVLVLHTFCVYTSSCS